MAMLRFGVVTLEEEEVELETETAGRNCCLAWPSRADASVT